MRASMTTPSRPMDEGFTLIELLVYVSLFAIVLFIVAGFMISSLKAERDVSSGAEATNSGQLISTSVQAAVRNGSAVRATVDAAENEMLTVRTRGAAASFVCRAFYYSASNDAVYVKSSALAIALPTKNPAGGWTLLGSRITPIGGAGVFSSTSDVSATMNFDIVAGSRGPVRIVTTVHTRDTRINALETAPCFS